MRTFYDIIDEVLVRANVTTTVSGLYTDTALRDWADQAHRFTAGHRKWPFTEGRSSTTYAGGEEMNYPEGWKSDSVRYLEIGDRRFRKLTFADYQRFREDQSDSDKRLFSDFGRVLFINPNADASGTLVAYGQYMPAAFDGTDNTATTVFSDAEEEGNEAIVERMLEYAKMREKKMDEALVHKNRAVEILENIWRRITGEQHGYQTYNRGMFERIDVLAGTGAEEGPKRDQFF